MSTVHSPLPSNSDRFTDRFDLAAPVADRLHRARDLRPSLRSRSAEAERARNVPAESVKELVDAGLFKIMQPARYGGDGRGFAEFVLLAEEIAAGCPATGWLYGNTVLKSWILSMFPVEAQDDVWGSDPDALMASILRPAGRSVPVDGGYRLSGKWVYASGVAHTQWTVMGSMRQGATPDARPEAVVHVVPRSDYRIEDNWHVAGLAGTGSQDVIVEDVFVPAHRTLTIREAQSATPPGAAAHPDSLTPRVPLMSSFGFFIAAPIVGIASGAIDAFVEHVGERQTTGAAQGGPSTTLADFQTIQVRVAEAQMRLDAARAVLLDAAAATIAGVADGDLDVDQRIANRRAQSFAARLAVEAVDLTFEAMGAGGLFLSNDLQRYWRDAHAGAAHFSVNWDAVRVMCGEHALGRDPELKYF